MNDKAASRRFYLLIMLGLVLWGILLALGAFLGPEFWTPQASQPGEAATAGAGDEPTTPRPLARSFDVRKPLIVLAFVGLFLAAWGLALRSRHKRLTRQVTSDEPSQPVAKKAP